MSIFHIQKFINKFNYFDCSSNYSLFITYLYLLVARHLRHYLPSLTSDSTLDMGCVCVCICESVYVHTCASIHTLTDSSYHAYIYVCCTFKYCRRSFLSSNPFIHSLKYLSHQLWPGPVFILSKTRSLLSRS